MGCLLLLLLVLVLADAGRDILKCFNSTSWTSVFASQGGGNESGKGCGAPVGVGWKMRGRGGIESGGGKENVQLLLVGESRGDEGVSINFA